MNAPVAITDNPMPAGVLAFAMSYRLPGDPIEHYPTILANLQTAEALGQLWRDVNVDGRCTGFIAWLRLTPEQLKIVVERNIRVFTPEDQTPDGSVAFVLEQLANEPGRMMARTHQLSAVPGIEILAGWRGTSLRLHRARKARP